MNIQENIEQILRDLYAIDPSFKNHERELRVVIENLLQHKPDTKFDQAFAENLKRHLKAHATLMQENSANKKSSMKKLTFLVTSLGLAAIVLVTINYKNNITNSPVSPKLLSAKVEIEHTSAGAFGNLNNNISASNQTARGMGGGGGGSAAANPVAPVEGYAASDVAPNSSKIAVAPPGMGGGVGIMPPKPLKYSYEGDPLTLNQDQVEVFQRQKGFDSGDLTSLIQQMNFGVANMESFSNLEVQQVTLNENKDFGYTITADFKEGLVYINMNWEKWPMPEKDCRDEQCYQSLRLKLSDIPGDEEVINVANSFLNEHNISTENYGQPEVQNLWKQEYENYADKSQFYIPDTLTVVYPLKINGEEVYDQGGNKTGLMVSVNVRFKKVSGVNELTGLKYQGSQYAAVTDQQKILDYLQNTQGYYAPYPMPLADGQEDSPSNSSGTVKLGTPKMALVKMWQYDNNASKELLVPSLIFPVENAGNTPYIYQKNVVVPLVKELLEVPAGGPVRY